MTTTAGKYSVFDDAPGSTHNLVVELVPSGANVLEFGCATGYMSAVLRKRLGCHVTGIEIDPAAAELARSRAERVIVGDAEQLDYELELGDERFEVILFADVLEHLREPSAVLRRVRPLLATGGSIVASIPNVAHGSVRLALVGGDFRYTPTGLLDESHLRFFTQESLLALFEEAGYVIVDWQHRRAAIDQTEVAAPEVPLPLAVREHIESDPVATTYQFVVRARRAEELAQVHSVRAELGALRAEIEGRDAAIRALKEHLAHRTAAAMEAARQAAEHDTIEGELRALVRDRAALRRELSGIRKLLCAQSVQLTSLIEQVANTGRLQSSLEIAVEEVRQAVLAGQDDLQATLYDLKAGLAQLKPDADHEYQRVIRRVQEVVRTATPRMATIAVVSRGDEALLDLYGRTGWHFPRGDDGGWAGEYPATSTGAMAQLEMLRARGAEFLVIPKPALWWLDFYTDLKRHLDNRYRLQRRDDACFLYDLRRPEATSWAASSPWQELAETIATARARLNHTPSVLDWDTRLDLAGRAPLLTVFSPPLPNARLLPYLDRTVEFVALASRDPTLQAEAGRVAAAAVLTFTRTTDDEIGLNVAWVDADDRRTEAPMTVSIVIPCYNHVAATTACLCAVQDTLPANVRTQIVVIDDASTDDTQRALRELAAHDDRLEIVRNSENLGFIRSCNRGAEVATGDLLVFLNNDTLPLPGWLESLIMLFRDRPDAGAVGGKLLYPDGRLQEAGNAVFADGSAANVGRGEHNADAPMFNFVREVDYCSGALLATPRALFRELGGFDPRYAPAYYEDADYCFGVRAKGYRVYYQPRSMIVHGEGVSSGTDLSSGVKRYQRLNQAKFAKKWAAALARQPQRPSDWGFSSWYELVMRRPSGEEDHSCVSPDTSHGAR
jgi:GT2 family glycosyltransferase/2-polyprenyl-3-methyl-5-hydroxy-6-metoxy-1,4-benzoquinol methylase